MLFNDVYRDDEYEHLQIDVIGLTVSYIFGSVRASGSFFTNKENLV